MLTTIRSLSLLTLLDIYISLTNTPEQYNMFGYHELARNS